CHRPTPGELRGRRRVGQRLPGRRRIAQLLGPRAPRRPRNLRARTRRPPSVLDRHAGNAADPVDRRHGIARDLSAAGPQGSPGAPVGSPKNAGSTPHFLAILIAGGYSESWPSVFGRTISQSARMPMIELRIMTDDIDN